MIADIVIQTKIITQLKKRDLPFYSIVFKRISDNEKLVRIYRTTDTFIETTLHNNNINKDIIEVVKLYKISMSK